MVLLLLLRTLLDLPVQPVILVQLDRQAQLDQQELLDRQGQQELTETE
jgi:hypothetical protein